MTHRAKSNLLAKSVTRESMRGLVRAAFSRITRSTAARAILIGIGIAVSLTSANAVWIGTNSLNQSVTVDLKTAGPSNFGVLAIGNSTNTLSFGTGTFNGNVGDAHINPALGGGTINGNVFLGNGVDSSNLVGGGTINGTVFSNQDSFLSQPIADANDAATAALSIRSTISRTTITDTWFGTSTTKTITGSANAGDTNVLRLSSINLTQGQTLILKAGAANQKFLLEVTGTFNLSLGARILVDAGSGLVPLDVLYALGANTHLTASGTASRASIIDGIILANTGNINISYGQVNGEVIGGCDLVFSQTTTSSGFSPIPEVSAFLPLLGLFSLATGGQIVMRRRVRPAAIA